MYRRGVERPGSPLCTICIANYNGEGLLADCIDSILRQPEANRLQIIVHDDASTDGSLALLESRYPQVDVIASDVNVGFCVGNNRMVEHAEGEYILLLNNDAALFDNAIDSLLAVATKHADGAILTLPQYDWQSGVLVDRGCLLDPFYNPVPVAEPQSDLVGMVIGACLWIPRRLWVELGGFPTWIESIGEDLYLCCAARLRGIPVLALSKSGYRHWQGKTFGGNRASAEGLVTTSRRRALSERNKTFVMITCTPSPLVWPLLMLHIMILFAEGLVLALWRRDASIFTRIYAPLPRSIASHWSLLVERRRANLATRSVSLRSYLKVFTWMPRKLSMLRRYGMPSVRT